MEGQFSHSWHVGHKKVHRLTDHTPCCTARVLRGLVPRPTGSAVRTSLFLMSLESMSTGSVEVPSIRLACLMDRQSSLVKGSRPGGTTP